MYIKLIDLCQRKQMSLDGPVDIHRARRGHIQHKHGIAPCEARLSHRQLRILDKDNRAAMSRIKWSIATEGDVGGAGRAYL